MEIIAKVQVENRVVTTLSEKSSRPMLCIPYLALVLWELSFNVYIFLTITYNGTVKENLVESILFMLFDAGSPNLVW